MKLTDSEKQVIRLIRRLAKQDRKYNPIFTVPMEDYLCSQETVEIYQVLATYGFVTLCFARHYDNPKVEHRGNKISRGRGEVVPIPEKIKIFAGKISGQQIISIYRKMLLGEYNETERSGMER
jgi:hypothetical protein